MGCEVSIQVHPMPPPEAEAEPIKDSKGSKVHPMPPPEAEAEPIKDSNESIKLTRQDSLASTVTIMLDESDFQCDV